MTTDRPESTEAAIYDMHARLVGLEKTLIGTPGTDDKGLCGDVKDAMTLAVEVKETTIDHGNRLTALETRCREIHGANGNRASSPSKKKQAGFLGTIGGFFAAILYGLGCKFGWW